MFPIRSHVAVTLTCAFICGMGMLLSGCASKPYQFGHGWRQPTAAAYPLSTSDTSVEVAEGKPNKFVDGAGWVLGIPGKVLLWDRRVNNHKVSAETTTSVATYLECNQMQDVVVRVNQYAPGEEWQRLCANRQVSPGWRYTLGSLSLVGYTLLPGRVFGGDRYNPYTNSVYIYSDIPALGIQAAAYAKDVHARKLPGTYAAVNELPILSLWHETIANKEAVGYVKATGTYEEQVGGLKTLHPSYGVHVGQSVEGLLGLWPVLQVGGAVVGHATAWHQTRHLSNPTPSDTTVSDSGNDVVAGGFVADRLVASHP